MGAKGPHGMSTDQLISIFDLIGTIAFALSGAMVGVRKKMDIFGVIVLGLTTAVGGGIIRDLILGITPPSAFVSPRDALTAIAVSVIFFIVAVYGHMAGSHKESEAVLLWMDAIGLGAFTVNGIHIAQTARPDSSAFLLIFVGVTTGVGGGILRDLLAGERPYIFTKHIYAVASLGGAIVCLLLDTVLPISLSMFAGILCIVILRLLAAHYKWNLPHA